MTEDDVVERFRRAQEASDSVPEEGEEAEERRAWRQAEALRVFEHEAAKPGPDNSPSFKVQTLMKQYEGKLSLDLCETLAPYMRFTAAFRHDIAPREALLLVPWPLAVLTKYQPGYWTEDPVGRSYHYIIHNLAQLRVDAKLREYTLREELRVKHPHLFVEPAAAPASSTATDGTGVYRDAEDRPSPCHPKYKGTRKKFEDDDDDEMPEAAAPAASSSSDSDSDKSSDDGDGSSSS